MAGIWRPPPARAPQERWHTITTCCLGEMPELRLKAAGWLSHRLSDFGTRQAYYALSALSGGADRLQPRERHAALRFFLGLPDEPKSQLIVESPEAARSLALAYGRGFLKWIVAILRQGSTAALAARKGPRAKVNAVRTTVACHRDLFRVIERPAPRSVWMASRGLREVWDGACLTRRAFRALRLWSTMAGPDVLVRAPRVRGVPTSEPDRRGGYDEGCQAYDQWDGYISFVTALANKLHTYSGKLLAIAGAHRRRLVWLRNAGFDPTIERRKQARIDERKQAALDARLRRQRHQEARAAIHRSRLERARVAREARAAALEAARLASAALTRPSRSSAAATMAAIDASVHVTQSSSFEAPQAHAPTSGDIQHVRLRCTRGHFLVPAPVRSGRDSFRPRCNGPCGLLLWPGTLRWMCEGVGCDLDICLECVAKDGAEGSSRGHTRCSQGHSMLFRLATAHTHLDRRCDGECRRPLGEGMWTYECAPCSLDLCAACAPGGIQPGDEPARAARAPRKRAREPPPHRARGRQMAHGDGPPRRAAKGERRRNLFDGDSDGGPDSDEFSQPAAQGGAHGLCGKRPREPEESPSHEAGGPQRQPYGEGPGRKRSAPPSIHSRGQGL